MAIKNFLRRFFGKELKVEADKSAEENSVPFEMLSSKIILELEAIEKKKETAKKEMAENRERFASELKNQITLLRNIDLRERKEIEKIKLITLENLKVYISHLEKLIENLTKNNGLDAKAYGEHIFKAIDKFKHSSYNSFEKATILIGKELEQTKRVIREFLDAHGKIVNSHKIVFEKEESLLQLQDILENYNSMKSALSENKKEILHLSEKMQNILQEKDNKERELNNFMISPAFQKSLEEKKRKLEEQNILNSEISRLKQQIDLKSLAKLFHNDMKKREIISAYKDNFLTALNNDEKLVISEMVEIARPELKIKESLDSIKKRYHSLQFVETSIIEKEIHIKEEEIQKLLTEKNFVENQLNEYRKKQERFKEKLKNIELELKNYAKNISWNVEFDK